MPRMIVAVLCAVRASAVSSRAAVGQAADAPTIRIVTDENSARPTAFEAVGLPADQLQRIARGKDGGAAFARFFTVCVFDDSEVTDRPPLVGGYVVKDN